MPQVEPNSLHPGAGLCGEESAGEVEGEEKCGWLLVATSSPDQHK